jgi:hypothetical protein
MTTVARSYHLLLPGKRPLERFFTSSQGANYRVPASSICEFQETHNDEVPWSPRAAGS